MGHYKLTAWADFARGITTEADSAAMQRHVDQGCRSCTARGAAMQPVVAVAAADRSAAPPDYAVRSVKAFFALNRPESVSLVERLGLTLTLNSAREPQLVGVRAAGEERRQLRYESRGHIVDLWLDRPDRLQTAVIGQIVSQAGEPLAAVPAYLMSEGRVSACGFTNEIGGFELAAQLGRKTELWVGPDEAHLIVVPLPIETGES